ncbi:hypothetical protein TPHA_0B02840 [Tetrapisispora phaffii CBS 4417]|uniref:Nucleolar complex protein 2 n=1 Tax=Tetrapisispora phaffii (strain ATCC 24235 / CBS 4417 / NBRC 1672 / NRRL Y-8282 / UCD 70-5) TaxID=1071381 RepID=G8BPM5_TETPH|nr:hypothetical protein TPHA_0B02840 [Tetrapisispora phaffii CBS 4417]CCE61956.1 hypothetical protein TPHA_0B02840 [Tetrapisispora phaffii CBS 4417]
MVSFSKSNKKSTSKKSARSNKSKPKPEKVQKFQEDKETSKLTEVEISEVVGAMPEKVEKQSKKSQKSKKSKKSKAVSDEESSSDDEDDAQTMKDTMEALSKDDPDFFKYLKENDGDLLKFESVNPLDAISDSESDDQDKQADNTKESEEEVEEVNTEEISSKVDLTVKLVNEWRESLTEKPTLKIIKEVIIAFKVAVHLNDDEKVEEFKYTVTDEKAFEELMFLTLKELPIFVQKMAPYTIKNETRILEPSNDVKRLSILLKSHATSLLILLNDVTNTSNAALVLFSVDKFLPYYLPYRKLLKKIILAIVDIWSTTRDVETQIATFAFLFSAAKEFKKSVLDLLLKTTYSTFIKYCRSTNMRSMPLINFQKNSAAELFALDPNLSYQVAFEYIRQLAINLRNAMTAMTKKTSRSNSAEAYKSIYNWQYCHSLDFWSRVLSLSCNHSLGSSKQANPLKELIYPLTQVTIGVIKLNPTPQYMPLRFYLIRSLIRLSQNTGTMIPIYPLLTEVLNTTAFTKKPKKKENLPAFDFEFNIKCNQAYLGTRAYQNGLGGEFIDILGEYLVLYSKSISFPEFVTPIAIGLRRYLKTNKTNFIFNKALANLLDKIKANVTYIEKRRSTADFSVSEVNEVANFLNEVSWENTPLGSYIVIQREIKEEKSRLQRESLEDADKDQLEKDIENVQKMLGDDNDEDDAVDIELSD